jgi:hypothetical protein
MIETWGEDDSIVLTVALVVDDGHRMRVRGAERIAVVRAMSSRGATLKEIAHRTESDPADISRLSRRLSLPLARRPSWVPTTKETP